MHRFDLLDMKPCCLEIFWERKPMFFLSSIAALPSWMNGLHHQLPTDVFLWCEWIFLWFWNLRKNFMRNDFFWAEPLRSGLWSYKTPIKWSHPNICSNIVSGSTIPVSSRKIVLKFFSLVLKIVVLVKKISSFLLIVVCKKTESMPTKKQSEVIEDERFVTGEVRVTFCMIDVLFS